MSLKSPAVLGLEIVWAFPKTCSFAFENSQSEVRLPEHRKVAILCLSKRQAVCGFGKKNQVLGAKISLLKRLNSQNLSSTHICHKWYLPLYLCKRFLPILREKNYRILFIKKKKKKKNSSYVTVMPTISLNGFRHQMGSLP